MTMFERLRRERMPSPESDANLLQAARRGNEEAMGALYQRHGSLIYRFALRAGQDASIAEEVTQEVFLVLLKQSERFDAGRAALSTWLCGIARRLVWKQLEQRQRQVSLDTDEEWDEIEAPEDDPGLQLTRSEAVNAVRQGIEELPLPLKEVVILCEFEELRYEDVALILDVPIGTVRSRLHRAKARLAKRLRELSPSTAKEVHR